MATAKKTPSTAVAVKKPVSSAVVSIQEQLKAQVAAMAAGFGDQVSYEALVRQMLRQEVDKGSRFTDWARRPLSDAQLVYALGDVTHLAALYPRLRDRLQRDGRLDWVMAEMEDLTDPALYDTDPEKAWKRR